MFKAQVVVETLSFEEGAEEVKVRFLKIEAPSGSIMEPLTQSLVDVLSNVGEESKSHWVRHPDNVGAKAIAMMVAAAQSSPREPLVSAKVDSDYKDFADYVERTKEEPVSAVGPEDFGGSDYDAELMF